jgi:hypothetical protein
VAPSGVNLVAHDGGSNTVGAWYPAPFRRVYASEMADLSPETIARFTEALNFLGCISWPSALKKTRAHLGEARFAAVVIENHDVIAPLVARMNFPHDGRAKAAAMLEEMRAAIEQNDFDRVASASAEVLRALGLFPRMD